MRNSSLLFFIAVCGATFALAADSGLKTVYFSQSDNDDEELQQRSISSVTGPVSPLKTVYYQQPEDDDDGLEHRIIPVTGPAAEYASDVKHFDCGTNDTLATDHFLNTIGSLHRGDIAVSKPGSPAAKAALAVRAAKAAAIQIKIPLYMHIVTTIANRNMVTAAQATAQFNALNTAYKPINVQFVLKNTSWNVNDTWAIGASSADDFAMKKALRQGSYGSLNLYFQSDLANGVLGKCTLPTFIGSNPTPSVYIADGCNIALGTMPKGPILGYNMGRTAVHETGHWLGLLHTFEGYSCTGNGDFIADTPAESQATSGCPTKPWKNTCNNRAGVDPVHNYMDYSIDACYERFTPGQQTRIQTLWSQYRNGK